MLHGDAVLEASVLDGRGPGAKCTAIMVPVLLMSARVQVYRTGRVA